MLMLTLGGFGQFAANLGGVRLRERQQVPGLKEEEFERIKVVEWKPSMKSQNQTFESCAICYNDYKRKEKLKVLKCGHAFHECCIKEWLMKKKTCPMCNKEVELPDEDEE